MKYINVNKLPYSHAAITAPPCSDSNMAQWENTLQRIMCEKHCLAVTS